MGGAEGGQLARALGRWRPDGYLFESLRRGVWTFLERAWGWSPRESSHLWVCVEIRMGGCEWVGGCFCVVQGGGQGVLLGAWVGGGGSCRPVDFIALALPRVAWRHQWGWGQPGQQGVGVKMQGLGTGRTHKPHGLPRRPLLKENARLCSAAPSPGTHKGVPAVSRGAQGNHHHHHHHQAAREASWSPSSTPNHRKKRGKDSRGGGGGKGGGGGGGVWLWVGWLRQAPPSCPILQAKSYTQRGTIRGVLFLSRPLNKQSRASSMAFWFSLS